MPNPSSVSGSGGVASWNQVTGIVLAILGIIAIFWQFASSEQSLRDRVKAIEDKDRFLHGEIQIPHTQE